MIEQGKFTYSSLEKGLEKQIKSILDQEKKQIKALEERGNQLVKSNELIEKDLNINRDSIPLEKQRKYLMNLLKKNLMNFKI